jgi:hypothetical protein
MTNRRSAAIDVAATIVDELTRSWGSRDAVSLYLDRCQVATPDRLVDSVWTQVRNRRSRIGKVVDFGAGDARLARGGKFRRYVGYEIDPRRSRGTVTAKNVSLLHRCAFSDRLDDADLCVGNPPYVRNQDLPRGWRQRAAKVVFERTGVALSGLANAWQYFFLLSLASAKKDGLVALIVPYEWVSRPSAAALRAYIQKEQWAVDVYRLRDDSFDRVLTTSSITIVDKSVRSARWSFHEETEAGVFRRLPSASGGVDGVLAYARRSESAEQGLRAKRGLSPGTQDVLTLTEGERVRAGLHIGSDVVRCVTSLRNISCHITALDKVFFDVCLRNAGAKCWLIRTDREPSTRLAAYLDGVNQEQYQTATCLSRDRWWEFTMPQVPDLLIASGFRGERPKIVENAVGARAVGSVCGIYGATKARRVVTAINGMDFSTAVVAHSNGLKKLEINQLNSVLAELDHE